MMVKYYDLNASEASTLPVKAGQLIFCRDSGDIFYDTADNVRTSMSDKVTFLATETVRKGMLAPVTDRIYCVLDSGKMYLYSGTDWIPIGSTTMSVLSNVVLEPGTWTGTTNAYKYTVTNDLIKYWHTVSLDFDLSIQDLAEANNIRVAAETDVTDGSIILTATTKPTYPLFLNIVLT